MNLFKDYTISDLFIVQTQVENKLRQSWLPERGQWEDFAEMIRGEISHRTEQLKDSIFLKQ